MREHNRRGRPPLPSGKEIREPEGSFGTQAEGTAREIALLRAWQRHPKDGFQLSIQRGTAEGKFGKLDQLALDLPRAEVFRLQITIENIMSHRWPFFRADPPLEFPTP